MLNTGFQVFNRTGGLVMPQISLGSFWSALGAAASGSFDPKILFDQYVDRWVAVSDSNSRSPQSHVLVGISDTDNPTGTWNLFAIKADPASTNWADYPGLGIDEANVYVTQNMFPNTTGSTYAKFWVISKASMIAGGALNMRTDVPTVLPGFTYQPCHSFDPSPGGLNYLVSQGWDVGGTPRRLILVNRYVGVGAAAVLTELGFVEVGGYTFSTLDAPQKDCSTNISTNDPRLLNAVLRNGKVWTTHSVGVGATINPAPATRAEIAWHELDPTVANIPGPYSFAIQDGRVGHATLAYYFPSIAVNADECVALGFSGSDASTYASAYYTARSPLDPPGTMQPVGTLHAGTASYWKQYSGTRNRWGDYSATVVDPVDDMTFWTTQEYATAPFFGGPICSQDGGRWGLWWGAFECTNTVTFSQLPDHDGEDLASNIDWSDPVPDPNVVLADDFVSDGRPITGVRWWGSNLSMGSATVASVTATSARASAPLRQQLAQPGYAKNEPDVGPETTRSPIPSENTTAGPGCAADTCAAAISVGSLPFNAGGNTCACTNHYDESCNTAPGSPDLVYAYTPSADECVNLSMCNGSDYDAVMFVYANACTPGTSIACNDDGCAPGGPSLISNLILTGGDTHYIVVSGWNGTQPCGNYVLDISRCPIECGNGFVEPGEQCEPPGSLTCDMTCQLVPSPPIDGWWISFHEHLQKNDPLAPPLALYFCDTTIVTVAPTSLGACDAHAVHQYEVDLVDCCLVRSYLDSRNGLTPGQPHAFLETACFDYDIDIQAVMGYTYTLGGGCVQTPTANSATIPFWGWHTTGTEHVLRPALRSMVSMAGPDWLYEPWANITPTCLAPNMAFQLLTDVGGNTLDCNENHIPDDCELASGAPDCQPNEIPDSCELGENDTNSNGRPDECDPTPPQGAGPPDRNRSLGLSSAAATAGPGAIRALRVTMVDLQNPVPPNLPQNPPPNFSAYEAGLNCTDPSGCVRWVGPPNTYLESQDSPGSGNYRAARLQCTPHYQDWTTAGLFYITGAEIVPSSAYDVHSFAASCATMETTCIDFSPTLRLTTARSGDVEAPFNPPSTTTQPDVTDVAQLVNKFKSLVGAPIKAISQLQPNLPELNADINALDILAVVDALKQKAYAFSGPCPCPSLMTCGSLAPPSGTPCATDAACIALPALSGGGPGAKCVKTCVGGTNDGEQCINDTHGHCPGGGVCGNGGTTPGFCRDRCGRCTPP